MSTNVKSVRHCLENMGEIGAEQSLKLAGVPQMIVGMSAPVVDATERTVSTNVHAMVDAAGNKQYGFIISVEATTGGTTGPCSIVSGTPLTTQVKVEYLSDGQPQLTFAGADAVTGCKVHWVSTGSFQGRSLATNLARPAGVG